MNKEELKARRANETPEQGVVNFLEHMKDIATSDKSKKMREMVKEELEHIPDWPEPQNELRMIYWTRRMHSLGKKAKSEQTAKEVLEECISDSKTKYPDFQFLYDESFFNECG
ncbi:MAG TPA: hypothetical protein VMW72_13435 [Sedimentisphaerales bacterium]|nr:hypothetical protein [Sedimentisphaerales bacterium]